MFLVTDRISVGNWDYLWFAALGLGAAAVGVVTMLGVTAIERTLRRRAIPFWLRPALGGVILGVIALPFPQVLGSGHGAVQQVLGGEFVPLALLLLMVAKALGSAVSVGAGFRGGLFSSSLFLGSLYGGAGAGLLAWVLPGWHVDHVAYMLVGMGAVAASIVGAPVTMILLILELTADFYVAMGVMVGVIVASLVTRLTFGYSFATWRFHLRGVPIRGAFDIGWIRDLTVEKIMRRDAHCAPADTSLAELRHRFPLGGPKRFFLTDGNGDFAGMVNTADLHDPDLKVEGETALALRKGENQFCCRSRIFGWRSTVSSVPNSKCSRFWLGLPNVASWVSSPRPMRCDATTTSWKGWAVRTWAWGAYLVRTEESSAQTCLFAYKKRLLSGPFAGTLSAHLSAAREMPASARRIITASGRMVFGLKISRPMWSAGACPRQKSRALAGAIRGPLPGVTDKPARHEQEEGIMKRLILAAAVAALLPIGGIRAVRRGP